MSLVLEQPTTPMVEFRCQPGSLTSTMPAVPLSYTAIAEDLATRIAGGEYKPGDQLPTYNELAALYSVSFATIARAIALLRDRGLIVGAAGRGTYVAE